MDTQPVPHARILRVEIVGGFFPRVVYDLVDGLNVLIGEKGAGKSTTLDILRYGLGCEGDWSQDAASRVANNLGGGTVTVRFETKGGVIYALSRKWSDLKDRSAPTVLTEDGRPAHVPLEAFRVEAFAHNEIERYAQSPEAQRALVDRAILEELSPLQVRIAQLERELARNKLELLRLEEEVRGLENQAMNAESIEAELERLAKADGPDASGVERAHAARGLRERELVAMSAVASTVETTRSDVETLVAGARRAFSVLLEEDVVRGPNGDLFAPLAASLRQTLDSLEAMATSFAGQATALQTTLARQQGELGARHVQQEHHYAVLLSKHPEHASRALERTRQQQRYAEIAGATRVLTLRSAELAHATETRNALATELAELRRSRSDLRARGIESLNATIGPGVRFTLQEAGESRDYAELLFEALKPVCAKRDLAQKLAASIPPDELFELAVARDAMQLVRGASEKPKRAEQTVKTLCENRSALLELQAIDTDDLVTIEVLHGAVFKELSKSSAGQKAGALLPILLLVDSCPLLIDQPEDNVGAKFFSGPGAEMLLARKRERQTLFASYNPNLIVCAKADKVFGLACPDGLQGAVFGEGSPRQMVDPMLEFLEGGREAFRARRSFYEGQEQ